MAKQSTRAKTPTPTPPPAPSTTEHTYEVDMAALLRAISSLVVLCLRSHVTTLIYTTTGPSMTPETAVQRADALIQAVHDSQPDLPDEGDR